MTRHPLYVPQGTQSRQAQVQHPPKANPGARGRGDQLGRTIFITFASCDQKFDGGSQ